MQIEGKFVKACKHYRIERKLRRPTDNMNVEDAYKYAFEETIACFTPKFDDKIAVHEEKKLVGNFDDILHLSFFAQRTHLSFRLTEASTNVWGWM